MKLEKIKKNLKLIIIFALVIFYLCLFVIYPFAKFKNNEKVLLNAAKRYLEVNSELAPTGSRVRTIKLSTLYSAKLIENDLKVPLSSKLCNVDSSFVKIKNESGNLKYYTYLRCGIYSSIVDHDGPNIELNGKDSIVINKGDKYTELGVKKVSDNTDGEINTKEVDITGKVNTNKIGTYKIKYTAIDSLDNKTVKTRNIKVVLRLKNVIKKDTNNGNTYKGNVNNNYIEFSNMLFRIYGVDENGNVKIVSNDAISYIDYDGIDNWSDNFYDHLSNSAKKYVVKSKYCTGEVNDLNTTKCSKYTKARNVYIPSIVDYNNSYDKDGFSYLSPRVLTILPNTKDNKILITKNVFVGDSYGKRFISLGNNYNYAIYPMIAIKGNILLTGGNGTITSPYKFESSKKANPGDKVNTINTGEYIRYSNSIWRFIEKDVDSTSKIILSSNYSIISTKYNDSKVKIYNPKTKGNVGYFISNDMTKNLDTSYLAKKNIKVPVYNKYAKYNDHKREDTYKTNIAAANIYDLFSTSCKGCWMINSSKNKNVSFNTSSNGDLNYINYDDEEYDVSLVTYLKNDVTIKSGNGTLYNPYIIVK